MAKYTIELRTLISIGYELDLKTYPIFDESYRTQLNDKIINHYYFHEIGTETPDRFNFYLKQKMNEIMPLYNQLYKNKLNEIVNFKSDDYTKTTQYDGEDSSNRTGSVTTTNDLTTNSTQHSEGIGNSTSTATNTDINSDTPQTPIKGSELPDGGFYASSASKSTANGTDNTTTEQDGTSNITNTGTVKNDDNTTITDTYGKHITETFSGYRGYNLLDIFDKYKNSFFNIDMMIIEELRPLFMLVY